jgi:hypothetical protein
MFSQSLRNLGTACRDVHTKALLRLKGVEAFTGICLSLSLSRRIEKPNTQTEVFGLSRDKRIMNYPPQSIAPYSCLSNNNGSNDFTSNFSQADKPLENYRSRAKLIVTSLLHYALPAIATGISAVVFYPINSEFSHAPDRERFSSLERLARAYRLKKIKR